MMLYYKALSIDNGKNVKYILKEKMGLSEKLMSKLKSNQSIYLNNLNTITSCTVQAGDLIKIIIDFDNKNDCTINLDDKPLDIIYEDEYILVIYKNSDTVVHPTWIHQNGTLVNQVLYYYISNNDFHKPRPLFRLDKNTSGLILFSKNEFIHEILSRQMQSKIFKKEYIGIAEGLFQNENGYIEEPILRKSGSIIERCVSPHGKYARTNYSIIKYLNKMTYLKFTLDTGRTHQIRVHCSYIGHPLLGDFLYNPNYNPEIFPRQALHLKNIEFIHPITNKVLKLEASIPCDMENILSSN